MLLAVKKRPRSARKKKRINLGTELSKYRSYSMWVCVYEKVRVVVLVARDCIQLWHCHRSLFPAATSTAAPARRTTLGQDEVGFLFLPPQAELHHSPWYNCKTNLSWKNSTSTAKVMCLSSVRSFQNCQHILRESKRKGLMWDFKVYSIGAKLTGFLSDVSLSRFFPKSGLQPADNHWWTSSSSASTAASSIAATRRSYRHKYNSQSDHECI